jgi:hypothetical protein
MGGKGRFCGQCGSQVRPGARFCAACGEITSAGSQPATQAGEEIGRTGRSRAAAGASGRAERDTLSRSRPSAEAAHPPGGETLDPLPGQQESAGGSRFSPPDDEPRPAWFGRPLIAGLVALVVAGLVAATLFIVHSFGHQAAPSAASAVAPATTQAPAPTPTPTFSSPSVSPGQAAQNLAALLAHSVNDRSSIDGAYHDAQVCGPGLGQDAQTFRNAARSREQLLSQLADMPSRSALPGQLLGDITSAWQASVRADKDYAKWAQDLVSAGCAGGNPSDPHFAAAKSPNLQATADKKAFVRQWNPLAVQYGLTVYRQGEL